MPRASGSGRCARARWCSPPGAIERPLVFAGNDRPGIMLAGAARTWLNRYGVLPGTRAVLVTAADEAYGAALELQQAGVYIACIADTRAAGEASARRARGRYPGAHRGLRAGHAAGGGA